MTRTINILSIIVAALAFPSIATDSGVDPQNRRRSASTRRPL
jgi:hypothetical protein